MLEIIIITADVTMLVINYLKEESMNRLDDK